ncbi:MAG: M3 family oligoendopeptidase [Haliscomenobacter sp.]|uniref:M3 family oligoendopeptidase n=1 Tax=Haliscomenobacter sp. TaxID=2717303 RepID=UPI0029B24A7B|nr:M3 family oligoendopeptidase [Haliscomenobacter sp.]MDX2067344.1 M3 family oligoendopeptidase [Haliscomenobacter sp.]
MRNLPATKTSACTDYSVPALPQTWEDVEPTFTQLLQRPIHSVQDLSTWITERSDLEAQLGETISWAYIQLSADNQSQAANQRYQYVIQEILPKLDPLDQALNKKLVESPYLNQLDTRRYEIYLRNIQASVDLFQEENVALNTDVQLKTKEYARIFSQMMIGMDGKQMTLQQANTILEEPNRQRRRNIYHKINRRILQDTAQLDQLFDELLQKRHAIARNAGMENYRDYAFQELGRFDYSSADCHDFHQAVKAEVLPILNELYLTRKQNLKVAQLRPWDLNADTAGQAPLHPFKDTNELLQKGIECLEQVHPEYARIIRLIQQNGFLDLASRPGKRPGGYNMPLQATRMPFVFMNATNSLGDLRTFMHESGHAIHFFLTRDYPLLFDRKFTFEVAELAAMTMELLTMDHWHLFFPNEADLRRAKITQLEHVLKVLPWIATIDQFQHWLYTHPNHTQEERRAKWTESFHAFTPGVLDYSSLEQYIENLWHKQLHLFEVPFYYIEYGFAQLGAIALWRQYRENPEQAVAAFTRAMRLGNTRSIREIYAEAGIRFDFSQEYVRDLGTFVRGEMEKLK